VEVPLANAPPFLDAALKIDQLWGLAPVNARLTPNAKLTVKNTKGWAANAQVEFFLNGMDAFEFPTPAPYGKFGSIGIGHVSNDGMTVSPDNGLPMIGMIGIHKM